MSEEQTPPGVLDPATEAPAVPQPAAGSAPWSQDLAFITDDAQRSQVDQYLREKWQPRMTQLEQTAAEARQAQNLMNDLINDPSSTMEALAAELNWTPQELQQVVEQEVAQPTEQAQDPRVQQAVEYYEQQQAETAYESEMNRVVAQNPGIDPEDLHPFVVTADGDFDQAVQLRNAYVERWNARYAPAEEPGQPAPPTLGADGATVPPTAPKAQTIHEAVDAMMANARATNDPPPVS